MSSSISNIFYTPLTYSRHISQTMVHSLFKALSLTNNDDSTDTTTDNTTTDNTSESEEEEKDPRDKIVEKPKDSEQEYRVFTLKNGLRCLLISDGDGESSKNSMVQVHKDIDSTDTGAACLSVGVGSVHNPRHAQG